jgi:hypothetical protein
MRRERSCRLRFITFRHGGDGGRRGKGGSGTGGLLPASNKGKEMSDFGIFGTPQSIDSASLGLGVWNRLAHLFFRIGSLLAGWASRTDTTMCKHREK